MDKKLSYDHPEGMPGDKRHPKWVKERKKYGFDSREMWSLDSTLARHIHPRLVMFKSIDPFVRDEEFNKKLDEAIWAFEFLGGEERWNTFDKKVWKRVDKALKGFAHIYIRLWT